MQRNATQDAAERPDVPTWVHKAFTVAGPVYAERRQEEPQRPPEVPTGDLTVSGRPGHVVIAGRVREATGGASEAEPVDAQGRAAKPSGRTSLDNSTEKGGSDFKSSQEKDLSAVVADPTIEEKLGKTAKRKRYTEEVVAELRREAEWLAYRLCQMDKKQRQISGLEMEAQDVNRLLARVEGCGSRLVYRSWERSGNRTLHAADFCNEHKLCVMCARGRAMKLVRKVLGRSLVLLGENRDWIPTMLTLTIKNGPDVGERIRHIFESLKKANQRRKDARKGKRSSTEFGKIQAAMFALEVKRGRNSGLFHPHLHAVVLREKKDFVDLPKLSQEWNEITKDSRNVDWRLMESAREMLKGATLSEVEDRLVKDLCEVFKYSLKFGEMEPADVLTVHRKTKGKHFRRMWGEYRGIKEPELGPDDESREFGRFFERWYQYVDQHYRLYDVQQGVQERKEVA